MTETTFTTKARVPAPVATVHRALTDPAALRVWLAEHAEVELPHRYEFWGRYTPEGDEPHQRLLHADEHSLRFSWLLAGEDTTVSIDLEPQDPNTTILSLSQTHFPGWEEAVKEDSVLGMLATFWTLTPAGFSKSGPLHASAERCSMTIPAAPATTRQPTPTGPGWQYVRTRSLILPPFPSIKRQTPRSRRARSCHWTCCARSCGSGATPGNGPPRCNGGPSTACAGHSPMVATSKHHNTIRSRPACARPLWTTCEQRLPAETPYRGG